jgi:hypothetical protein
MLAQGSLIALRCTFHARRTKSYYEVMKVGQRGRVNDSISPKKAPKKLNLDKWRGCCGNSFAKLRYSSVDKFIDDIRGR